jgi:PAS domain S-box-containing protein
MDERRMKKAELLAELERTRDQLRRTEQLARIGSWTWDVDAGVAAWSEGMYRHYRLAPDDPRSPVDISLSAIHPDDLPRLRESMMRARDSGRLDPMEYRIRVGDSIRHHRTEGEVVRDPVTGAVRMFGFVQDVTALKEAEENRRRAEQERDRLFESSIDLFAVAGFDGTFKQLNPAWGRALGWTFEELTSRPWIEFVHPDDRERSLAGAVRLERGESLTGFENRYRRRDGSYRWLSWNARPSAAEGLMFAVARDVTEEKAAREALEAESSFRTSLLKGAAEGLAVYRETREHPFAEFTVWNDRMTEITGYDMEEINRLGWVQAVFPDAEVRDRAAERMSRMSSGGDLHGEEWVITRRDGAPRVVRISTSVLRGFDDQVHVLALMDDVTERRRAEEALRESEERYRSLFEGAPYGIFRVAPDGRFVSVNPALAAMLGIESPSSLLGRSFEELSPEPGGWSRFLSDCQSERMRGVDLVWRRSDGTPITVRVTGRPLAGDNGHPAGFEMIAEDATERRLLEEQFRQSQKMEAVGRLAGGIAHDFNNLLTAITGYADLLRSRLPQDDPRRGYVEEILGAADRAAALTRQLLAFSRRQLLQPRVLDLKETVRNAERMLGRIIGEDIELTTRLESRGHVRADPSQLEQVLLNLAVNARDAMPNGGRLVLEARDVQIPEGFAASRGPMPAGTYVLLAVSDTGMGMDQSALSHIFEPFFTTKEPGKGTGLGLATVYGIVKQSGGYIWATSELHRGARFEIYLPHVEKDGDAAQAPAGPEPELEGGKETVLLVEDEEGVRRTVREMLEWYGYRVLPASGATEAVALARSHEAPIHLLLTDVVMPRLGGRELRSAVASYRPRIPVLYISGYAGEGVNEELLEDGAAFLAKPFTAAALAQKVREVLRAPPSGTSGLR